MNISLRKYLNKEQLEFIENCNFKLLLGGRDMKKQVEQHIQTSIIKYIKSIGGLPIKQNQIGIYAQAGIPDIIACIKGRFVAIEVKRPGEKPTPIQEAFLESIAKKGGVAFWSDNLDRVKSLLKKENLV